MFNKLPYFMSIFPNKLLGSPKNVAY